MTCVAKRAAGCACCCCCTHSNEADIDQLDFLQHVAAALRMRPSRQHAFQIMKIRYTNQQTDAASSCSSSNSDGSGNSSSNGSRSKRKQKQNALLESTTCNMLLRVRVAVVVAADAVAAAAVACVNCLPIKWHSRESRKLLETEMCSSWLLLLLLLAMLLLLLLPISCHLLTTRCGYCLAFCIKFLASTEIGLEGSCRLATRLSLSHSLSRSLSLASFYACSTLPTRPSSSLPAPCSPQQLLPPTVVAAKCPRHGLIMVLATALAGAATAATATVAAPAN